MKVSGHELRWAGLCTAVFAGVFFLGLNLWSAYGIFVEGQIETKFGGPWENFVLGLQFTAAAVGFSAAGYFGGALLRRRRLMMGRRGTRLVACAAAGLAAVAGGSSGFFGRAFEVLVPGDSVICIAIGFLGTGFALSICAAEIGALVRSSR